MLTGILGSIGNGVVTVANDSSSNYFHHIILFEDGYIPKIRP